MTAECDVSALMEGKGAENVGEGSDDSLENVSLTNKRHAK